MEWQGGGPLMLHSNKAGSCNLRANEDSPSSSQVWSALRTELMSPSERVPSAPNAEDKADAVVRRELAAAAASCLRRCSAALGPAALDDLVLSDAGVTGALLRALQLPQHSHDDADEAACAEADRTVMCAAAALAAVSMQLVAVGCCCSIPGCSYYAFFYGGL